MKLRLPNKMQAALVAAITAVSLTTLSSGAYGAELDPDNLLCTIAPGDGDVASIKLKDDTSYTSSGAAFGGYGVSGTAFTTEGGKYLGLDSWDTKAGKGVYDKFGSPTNSSLTMVFDASITRYDTEANNALVYYGYNDTNSGYALSIVNGNWTIQWGGKGGLSTSGLTTAYSSTANTSDTAKHNYILTFNNNVITAYQDDVMIAQSTGGSTVQSGGLDWTLGALTVDGRKSNSHGYTSTISDIQLYSGVVTPTAAQDYVWTGSQSGTWDTVTTNWKTATLEAVAFKPGTDNTVTFNADGQQKNVTLATTALVKGMTVTGAEYTLNLGGNTLTTETLTINEGATLTVDGTGNMTLNSLSGAGTLAKNNGDTVVTIKQAANSFSGTIAVNAGTLVADAVNALNGSRVSVGTGGTLVLKTTDLSVPNISGAGTVQIDVGNTTKYEYHNKGFLEDFTGTVDIVSGKVQLGTQTNKFAKAKLKLTGGSLEGWGNTFTHAIELAGGTLADAGGDETYSGAISVTANSTVNANSGKTVTLSGALTGTGEITKAGAGTLKLAGTSTEFAGGLYADAGTVNITTTTTLGSLRVGSGTLNIKADTTVNGTLTIGTDNGHYAGTLVVDTDKTLSVASISTPWGFNTMTVNGTLTVGDGGQFSITSNQNNKVVNGTGTINTPKLIIGNANTKGIFAGGLTLNIGNGGIGGSDASHIKPVEFRDVTVGVLGGSTGWSAANAITLAAGEGMATTFDVGTDKTVTLNGVVSGSGALAKTGDGTLRLTATNTFTGNITVSAGTLDIAGSINPAVSIVVAEDATLTGSGADAKKVGIASGATATFTGAITSDGDGVSFTREGGVQVTNTKAEGDPLQYALNKSDLRVTADRLTANSTEQVEVANQLAVTKVENTGTGALSLTTGRDLSAIKEVFATSGDIHFLNVGNDAQALLSTLSLADGKTVSFNTGTVAGEDDEATVTVTGMLVAGGPDSKLYANLVIGVAEGSPAVLDVSAMEGIGGLNMGSSVTLNPMNVALSNEDMEMITGLEFGGMYDLFNGVDGFNIGGNPYGYTDAWVKASDVFTNQGLIDQDYYLFYSGANQGGVGGNVGTIYIMQMPEPTTGTLSLLALCALAARRRRK